MADEGLLIDNRTELPDEAIEGAVLDYFTETASVLGARQSTYQTQVVQGNLLARQSFRPPADVFEEIAHARELAENDDDVGAAIGEMVAIAFGEGMRNLHTDDVALRAFNAAARHANLDGVFKDLYREYLIAGQVTTVALFERTPVDLPGGSESMALPRIGKLESERVRVLTPDLFGNSPLAYIPDGKLEDWLRRYFDPRTSPALKAELRRQDPVSAQLFTGKVEVDELMGTTTEAYTLNPRMAKRVTMPKDGPYPRPPLARAFALLEAKRLLSLLDYALLQGGINFIVVAKKGSDQKPAQQPEIDNLVHQVQRASRSGVLVGDHRVSLEIITPKLDEMLNADKRKMLGRKIAMAMLRRSEAATEAPGGEGMRADVEIVARVIDSDRRDLKRHVERTVYDEVRLRNARIRDEDVARIWFPKIILQGSQYFTDFVLKLRDRGDIPRMWATEAAGFDSEAAIADRKRELEADVDEVMAPAAVPFTGDAGPQDNNDGRPRGGSSDNGQPGARRGGGMDELERRRRRTINRNAGETIKAMLDEETGEAVRVGERTYEILAEYAATREIGRITPIERRALESGEAVKDGPTAIIPVNAAYEVGDVKALRLAPGLSMLVGNRRGDRALVAKALCFREPEFDSLTAQETALRWGFDVAGVTEPELGAAPAGNPPTQLVVLDGRGGRVRKTIARDEHGNIVGIDEEPVGEDE